MTRLTNALLADGRRVDIGISDGRIASIDPAGAETFQRRGCRFGVTGPVSVIERVHHDFRDERIVFDNEDVRSVCHCALDRLSAVNILA